MTVKEAVTIDMGTSGWKILYGKKKFFIPSLVATGPIRESVNGLFEADYSNKPIDNIEVETPLGPRFVGNSAKRSQSLPWSGHNKTRYATQDFMDPMTLAAFSEAGIETQTGVLTTAVPASWIDQTVFCDGKDKSITKVIEDHFQRMHFVNRKNKKGNEKQVNIFEVHTLTETKGLLYSFLMKPNGTQAIDDMMNLRIVVVDIGELTTCIDDFYALERERDSLTLTDVSMGGIHGRVADRIKSKTGRNIQSWEVRDIVTNGGHIMTNTSRGPKPFDIMPLYQEEVQADQRLLLSRLGGFMPNIDDVHYILIGGGGSEALGPVVENNFRQTKILGRYATAQGLHNYGSWKCL